MVNVGVAADLSIQQSELIEQFSQELRQHELVKDYWTDGLKRDFESVSSMQLQPGRSILLATIISAGLEQGGKFIAAPIINPILDTSGSQASHRYTVNDFCRKSELMCHSYLSVYLWHTINHTPDRPDIVGVCSGKDFSPPYFDVRRVHIESVVRSIPFLRLFGVQHNDNGKGGYGYSMKEFL